MSGHSEEVRIGVALAEVHAELLGAVSKFPPMVSPHEGWSIIREEVDELWDEIKKQHDARTNSNMRKEAKQVAAMALRFMVDLTHSERTTLFRDVTEE